MLGSLMTQPHASASDRNIDLAFDPDVVGKIQKYTAFSTARHTQSNSRLAYSPHRPFLVFQELAHQCTAEETVCSIAGGVGALIDFDAIGSALMVPPRFVDPSTSTAFHLVVLTACTARWRIDPSHALF
jgi:hypothetical protein